MIEQPADIAAKHLSLAKRIKALADANPVLHNAEKGHLEEVLASEQSFWHKLRGETTPS